MSSSDWFFTAIIWLIAIIYGIIRLKMDYNKEFKKQKRLTEYKVKV